MLPDPSLSLTLPSLHDGTPLDCRIYLPPAVLAPAAHGGTAATAAAGRWQGHAAVIAHPYAPLGGSYNDAVVRMIAETLLGQQVPANTAATAAAAAQFVVATFNFRGAGRRPSGHTSWTAKPETGDYMAVAGFLYYFVHHLDPYGVKSADPPAPPASPAAPTATTPPVFLSAGYSYGAVITRLLPPLSFILGLLSRPPLASSAAEIRRRAARWAALQNADFAACRAEAETELLTGPGAAGCLPTHHSSGSIRLSMGLRVGSDEDAQWRRRSHESARLTKQPPKTPQSPRPLDARPPRTPRSPNTLKKRETLPPETQPATERRPLDSSGDEQSQRASRHGLVARVRGHCRQGSGEKAGVPRIEEPDMLPALAGLPAVRAAYLLVSPPVGLATNLLTLFTFPPLLPGSLFRRQHSGVGANALKTSASSQPGTSSEGSVAEDDDLPSEAKLTSHPTLVVYGGADGFLSARKMRHWVARMEAAAPVAAGTRKKQFQAVEVATAGHFWAEGQTDLELRDAVEAFVADLVGR